jgi:hypothetical protein
MTPDLASHDVIYSGGANSESLGNAAMTRRPTHRPNLGDIIACQLGVPSVRANDGSALCPHVCHVVVVGAKEEMTRIAATRIVATGAVVEHPHPIGHRTNKRLVHHSVGVKTTTRSRLAGEAVPPFMNTLADPVPAGIIAAALVDVSLHPLKRRLCRALAVARTATKPIARLAWLEQRAAMIAGIQRGIVGVHLGGPPELPTPGAVTRSRGFSLEELYHAAT